MSRGTVEGTTTSRRGTTKPGNTPRCAARWSGSAPPAGVTHECWTKLPGQDLFIRFVPSKRRTIAVGRLFEPAADLGGSAGPGRGRRSQERPLGQGQRVEQREDQEPGQRGGRRQSPARPPPSPVAGRPGLAIQLVRQLVRKGEQEEGPDRIEVRDLRPAEVDHHQFREDVDQLQRPCPAEHPTITRNPLNTSLSAKATSQQPVFSRGSV